MVFTENQVFDVCKKIAPNYNFDVTLIQALCKQECEHRIIKNGKLVFDPKSYRTDKARLEQGYYERYVERQNEFATTTEILFACSFGVTQMMALSLKELKFFEWYFEQSSDMMQQLLNKPYSQFAVVSAIDAYCDRLEWQIEWGCKWLDYKRKLAKSDIILTLSYWNGDSSPEHKYANEVLSKKRDIELNS